ncbi:MAG: hypothetical protein OHK0057_12420 [Thermoflexibacter sp.]
MNRKLYIIAMLILTNTLISRQLSHAQVYEIYKESTLPSREPFVLQSPDNKYRIEGIDFIRPSGFTPYSSKVFIKVYDNTNNKKINTLKIKGYDTVKQIAFSKNGKYLQKFILADNEEKIVVGFQGRGYQMVELSKFKDELHFSIGDAGMSMKLFGY